MQMKSFSFKTSDGTELWMHRWIPDLEQDIKGVVQIHHGLAEHSLRYDRIGSILAENGYVCNAYDMRGHGKTAEIAEEKGTGKFGKLASKDGFNTVVNDLGEVLSSLKQEYADKKLVLFGHSFGSFVTQGVIEVPEYSKLLDGCVLCGTAGPRQGLMTFGKIFVSLIKNIKGEDSIVKVLDKLAFGNYNKTFESPETDHDWLSRDKMNVQMFFSDKWCNIPLTTSFFNDMMCGLKQIHTSQNIKKIPNDLPIYVIYGEDDPVGDYGKTIKKLCKIYQKNGIKDLQIKSYPQDRHEIFNEVDKEIVEQDFLNWLQNTLTITKD